MTFRAPDSDVVTAATELAGRCGATRLEFGHLHDDVPVDQAAWWAKARCGDSVIMVENKPGPEEALGALAERLLSGAQCQHCGGLVAMAYPDSARPDGVRWSREEIEAAGLCRWRREGPRWEHGCVLPPEGTDTLHSAEKLAQALEELQDPRVRPLYWRARRGYYHEFLSPLPFPLMQLVEDLHKLGLTEFAERVKNGEFDATKAESEAWGRSDEGQDAFNSLVSTSPAAAPAPPQATGAAFWQAQRLQ